MRIHCIKKKTLQFSVWCKRGYACVEACFVCCSTVHVVLYCSTVVLYCSTVHVVLYCSTVVLYM